MIPKVNLLTRSKPIQGNLVVSHAKHVKFADGQVLELNRKERRRMKIYNSDLVKSK